MTVLVTKYQLVDRDANDVGPKWKGKLRYALVFEYERLEKGGGNRLMTQ